jgi:hypothetical protein
MMLMLEFFEVCTSEMILWWIIITFHSWRVCINAKAYKFNHNDFEDLEKLILRNPDTIIYIVTESVFFFFFHWMGIVQI